MLSDPGFVSASDLYVAVRFDPYEDPETAKIVETVAGDLKNAGALIGTPDAKQFYRLGDVGRAARGNLAQAMREFAFRYAPNAAAAKTPGPVPWLKSVYEALNIAHCDARPLVLVLTDGAPLATDVESRLRAFAAGDAFRGQFHFVRTAKASEAKAVTGFDGKPGIYFIEPKNFGLAGVVISRSPLTAERTALDPQAKSALAAFAQNHNPLDRDTHINSGHFWGYKWAEGQPSGQGTVPRNSGQPGGQ